MRFMTQLYVSGLPKNLSTGFTADILRTDTGVTDDGFFQVSQQAGSMSEHAQHQSSGTSSPKLKQPSLMSLISPVVALYQPGVVFRLCNENEHSEQPCE